jgi:hypothetical protein
MKVDLNQLNKFNDRNNKQYIEDLEIEIIEEKFQNLSPNNNSGNNFHDIIDEKLNIVELLVNYNAESSSNYFRGFAPQLEMINECDEESALIIKTLPNKAPEEINFANSLSEIFPECKIPLAGDNPNSCADYMAINSH